MTDALFTIAVLLTAAGSYLLGWSRGRGEFDRLWEYANEQHRNAIEMARFAEQIQEENWSLRRALGHKPVCDVCGCPADVCMHGPGVVGGTVYECRECFEEGLKLLEGDNER